jgi:hypothetical protein
MPLKRCSLQSLFQLCHMVQLMLGNCDQMSYPPSLLRSSHLMIAFLPVTCELSLGSLVPSMNMLAVRHK